MKVAINKCFGGFCLSDKAIKRLLNLKDKECFFYKQTKWNFYDGIDEYSLIDGDDDDIFKHSVTRYLGEKINELPEEDYFYKECYWGGFSRSIILPCEVQASKVKASLKNGVLTVTLPKIINKKAVKISVDVK